ncbi:hypothetical protein D3C75_821370 [compost metagenome]
MSFCNCSPIHLDRPNHAAPGGIVHERQLNRLPDSVIAAVALQLLRLRGSVLNLKLHIINGDVMGSGNAGAIHFTHQEFQRQRILHTLAEFVFVMSAFRRHVNGLAKRRLIRCILRVDADLAGDAGFGIKLNDVFRSASYFQPVLEQHDRIILGAGIRNAEFGGPVRYCCRALSSLLGQQPFPAAPAKAEISVGQRVIDQRRIIIGAGAEQDEIVQTYGARRAAKPQNELPFIIRCSGKCRELGSNSLRPRSKLHLLRSIERSVFAS